jgi:hypothetical protein
VVLVPENSIAHTQQTMLISRKRERAVDDRVDRAKKLRKFVTQLLDAECSVLLREASRARLFDSSDQPAFVVRQHSIA